MSAPIQPTVTVKSYAFRKEREQSWRELEQLLEWARRHGVASLAADELERLPLLYRATLSSLSVARAIALDRHLLLYLEDLALRAYLVVYAPRYGLLDGIRDFFRRDFPAAVRQVRWHILVALLALLAGTAVGFALTVSDEAWFSTFVPAGLAGERGPLSTREELLRHEIYAPWPGFVASFVTLANFLFQHNTMVGILSFSLGVAAGVPTLLLTLSQGLMFGAFLALHYNRRLLWESLGWVSMHGGTEFGAIILCAAAGLLLAEKAVFPGQYGRLDSMARAGGPAARVAVGAMVMFFIAAVLEGGVRQLVQNTGLRLAIGLTIGVTWLLYFALAGRRARP